LNRISTVLPSGKTQFSPTANLAGFAVSIGLHNLSGLL